MNIPTAIEHLEEIAEGMDIISLPGDYEAVKLGIKALERIFYLRSNIPKELALLLKGETED